MIIRKKCSIFIKIYDFYQKEKKLVNAKNLFVYVVHIRALKQALNHELVLRKVHRVIIFNQRAWLKPYIDINTKKRMESKNEFEKNSFKLMINSVFGKTMGNLRKHRDIKLVTIDGKRIKLISEPNYHTTRRFSES